MFGRLHTTKQPKDESVSRMATNQNSIARFTFSVLLYKASSSTGGGAFRHISLLKNNSGHENEGAAVRRARICLPQYVFVCSPEDSAQNKMKLC